MKAAGPTSEPRTTLSLLDDTVESRPRNLVAWWRSLTKTTSQMKIYQGDQGLTAYGQSGVLKHVKGLGEVE